ncbi:EcsC family protein [[Mycobacterium] wendilense]|uniref:EcsC family protein n=1 Tax=[Mycobacterium] wendilense TaxID=3064284 RepID=A0ABM9MCG2_9MYCO|nr:EcsC family protein [Mycolicibacterium sp. MU0050]CAJ1581889.1 EcsC family protein [Mycolicibacterium sp. MU0050]
MGVNGLGPYKSASAMAQEVLGTHGEAELAIKQLVAIHRRWVGTTGFATGIGGLATLGVALPADITTFYMLSARMSASIAALRGYDLTSEEVQSAVLISLLGAGAAGVLGKAGVDIGAKSAMVGLKRLPGHVLIEINKKVGYRLLTKFGTKGSINLVKAVPLVGGGVGAGVNVLAINQIAAYSKRTFAPLGSNPA